MQQVNEQHRGRPLDFTERLMDEQKPGGVRAYIHTGQLIDTAWENYASVFSLLAGAEGATPVAPYNLVRPAFEAAFHALWILDPYDPKERCLRGLRIAHEDNRQKTNWLEELVKIPFLTTVQRDQMFDSVRSASAVYRREAEELGVRWPMVTQSMSTLHELARLSDVRNDPEGVVGPTILAAWRQLSGYQHGHVYAVLSGSSHEVVANISGGVTGRVTIDDSAFGTSLQVPALMQVWAMSAYIGRCQRPSRPSS